MLLIKFVRPDPDHVNGFLNGSVFFKNTGYFIDLEKSEKIKGIGDKYEGALFRHLDTEKSILMIEYKGEKFVLPTKRGFMTQTNGSIRSLMLSCFTAISYSLDDLYLADDLKIENEEAIYKIKPSIIEGLAKEFEGRIPIIIRDHELFFDRLNKKASIEGIDYIADVVKYFDEYSKYPLTEEEAEKNIYKPLFYKRKYFEAQKEYRIIASNPSGKDSLTIEVGDLRDCAMQLSSIQDLYGIGFTSGITEKHSV
ncbi:hypothetical protein HPX95_20340 [Bacillus tequilensis]|uniref:hypothetical protein n=1 Tax=Bacillus tequilensis TaxID=227866 RepID=UPI001575F11F|nr:hypothetical protein [Bacillus tequilensis]NTU28481.1 hypothetical protein [Bacillus tequilensis]